MYAITSAGVVHAVTKTCSMGNLTDCSCDVSRNGVFNEEGWQWGGCSDNVAYGVKIGKQFVDAAEDTDSKVRNAMNLHNNEVGRQVIFCHFLVSVVVQIGIFESMTLGPRALGFDLAKRRCLNMESKVSKTWKVILVVFTIEVGDFDFGAYSHDKFIVIFYSLLH